MGRNSPRKSSELVRHQSRKRDSGRSASRRSTTNGIKARARGAGGRARRSASSCRGSDTELLPSMVEADATRWGETFSARPDAPLADRKVFDWMLTRAMNY
jgi:hypothetical protein